MTLLDIMNKLRKFVSTHITENNKIITLKWHSCS